MKPKYIYRGDFNTLFSVCTQSTFSAEPGLRLSGKIAGAEFLDSIYVRLAGKIAEAEFLDSTYVRFAGKIAEAEFLDSIYVRLAGKNSRS